jgi:hypothetical protein
VALIFLVLLVIVVSSVAITALLNLLARISRPAVVVGTMAVSGIGAVSAGFLLYIVSIAWVGEIPAGNIVWPCLTWSTIVVGSLMAGAGRGMHFVVRATPWLVLGGITMLGAITQARKFVPAVVLLLMGIAYGSVAGARAASKDVDQSVNSTIRRGRAPAVGPYKIDMKTSEISRLVELTQAEKAALGAAVEFRNEHIYHAPPADFAGARWEVVLGAVDSQVYKVSALLSSPGRAQRDTMWRNVDTRLRATLGAPAEATAALMAWDTEDGNVVVNQAEGGGAYVLVLTITSSAVSGFVRIR